MNAFWALVSGIFFACMGVFVKLGSASFSSTELVFYRSAIGLVLVSGIVIQNKLPVRTAHLPVHLSRSLAGLVGLVLYFYVIASLPLATAVTLNHTAPLFLVALSTVMLGERPRPLQVVAVLTGFAGVLLLLRPTMMQDQLFPMLVGLVVGFSTAIGYANMKQLGAAGEPEWRVVFYLTLVCTAATGAWLLVSGFHPITWENVWIIIGLGVTSTIAQLAITRAYKLGRTLLVTTLTYTNIVFASILAAVIWREMPPVLEWIAFAVIALGGILASAQIRKGPAPTGLSPREHKDA